MFLAGMKHTLFLTLLVVVLVFTGCHSNGVSGEKKFSISKDECFAEKPDTCPRCGMPVVFNVIYGICDESSPPGYYIGKCHMDDYDPDWGCNNCDAHLWSKDRLNDKLEVLPPEGLSQE